MKTLLLANIILWFASLLLYMGAPLFHTKSVLVVYKIEAEEPQHQYLNGYYMPRQRVLFMKHVTYYDHTEN